MGIILLSQTKYTYMKKQLMLLLLCLGCITGTYAQDKRVTIHRNNAEITQVMSDIEKQTDYLFIYNQDVNVKIRRTVKADNQKVSTVLDNLFAGTNISYELKGKHILLTKGTASSKKSDHATLPTTPKKQKITGRVVDANGEPVIGATVMEKGTQNGTVTNLDGRFSLDVSEGATVKVSYIGCMPQTLKATGSKPLNISLQEDRNNLDEVVVVGYGTMKKSDLTSSISTVNSDVIGQAASPNISDILQGKIPGLDIQAQRYEGESRSMNIRGTRSLTASNEPLTIIDGIPGTMSDVNVNDIESIEVMKDASSAAIYGSQGANGVIIITTKRGKSGKTRVSYTGYYGINKPVFADMMNGEKFVKMKQDAYLMANNMWTKGNRGTVDNSVLFTPDELSVIESGKYYDWYDLVYRNGSILSNDVSLTGGSERTTFKLSVGYDYSRGYVKTNDTKNLFLSANIDHKVNDAISFGAVVRYKNRSDSGFATYGQALFYGTPVTRPYDGDGKIIEIPNTNEGAYNILLNYQDGQYINDNKSDRLNLLGYLDIKFCHDLTMHTNIGANINNIRTGYFYGKDSYTSHGKNRSGRTSTHNSHLTGNNTITYAHKFGEHSLTVDFVQELQKYETDNMSAYGENEDVETVTYYNLSTNLENKNIGSGYSKWTMASFMGRVRYDYNAKYLFNASIRSDGSSRLAEGHKWGTFLSAGAAWRLSSENFLKDVNWLSNLKLRLSYGEVGNQAIIVYQTLGNLSAYPVLFGDNGVYGYRPDHLVNKDLGWERTKTTNIGLDFGFFNNRISGSIDVYKASTSDLLMNRSLPMTIGYSNIIDNIGSTQNKGIEVSLNANVIETSKMSLDIYGTFSYNKNKITKLATDEDDITNGWFIGKPISVIYDYKKIGIWQLGEEEEAAKYNCIPGDIKILDKEGTSQGIDADDKTFLGQRDPKYIASLGFRFTWKDFDFAINTSGRFGHIISSDYYGYNLITSGNRWCADVDYWTPDNPTNKWPRAANDIANRSLCSYMKGDYIKIQDLTIGYDFAKLLSSFCNLRIGKARLYCQLRNFACLYKAAGHGVNPESTSTELTVPRSYNIGLNINF